MRCMQKQPGAKKGAGFISGAENYITIVSMRLLTTAETNVLKLSNIRHGDGDDDLKRHNDKKEDKIDVAHEYNKYKLPNYCDKFLTEEIITEAKQ